MEKELCFALEKEISEVKKVIQRVAKDLKKLPQGRLEVGLVQRKYVQYHVVHNENGKKTRSFIPRENIKLAEQLAQKAYETKLAKAAKKQCKALEQAVRVLKEDGVEAVYKKETAERKKLIYPVIATDEQYIEQWYEEHPGGQNGFPKTTAYTTIKGETVRSKSEKMIADAYYVNGVPYIYEPKVLLTNGRTKCPDFAMLNVRTRKTLYHEHLGMMDDEEYRQTAILKIREYNKNGYPYGEKMIYTFEGENIPFDQTELESLIKEFLM